MNDQDYMHLALRLAKRGCGYVNPNPMVGAVIVNDGMVIGEGFHKQYGGLHAEREALNHCRESPKGATIYVTLEPCCHKGKQPPCTEAIIESGIRRVVIGSPDPNPMVKGKGIQQLREHNIEVIEGVLLEACNQLNQVFFHYIQTGLPYVTMKYAMTMDGKIAASSGASKWITGEMARKRVHEDRNRNAAIMVGVGTVLADNPLLTCRQPGGRNPIRIICDTHLRTPMDANVVTTARQVPTILATSCTEERKHQGYQQHGCQILVVPEKDGHIHLQELMQQLGKQGTDSVFIEGGAQLNWSALHSGIVCKLQTYIAPKLFGGTQAPSPVAGKGVWMPEDAFGLSAPQITMLGNDILIESEVTGCLLE